MIRTSETDTGVRFELYEEAQVPPKLGGFWDLDLSDGENAVFSNCRLPRSGAILSFDSDVGSVLSVELPTDDTSDLVLAVEWDTNLGHVEVVAKATFTEAVDTATPEDSVTLKGPVCRIRKTGSTWAETEDYRHLLIGALYG